MGHRNQTGETKMTNSPWNISDEQAAKIDIARSFNIDPDKVQEVIDQAAGPFPFEEEVEKEVVAFKVGETYSTRSACDHDCIFSYEVISRTAQFVTLKGSGDRVRRCKVRHWDNVEVCDPEGRYSMSPVVKAG
jgi:hypothetical protein